MGDLVKNPGLNRRLAIVLAVSLAVNFFFGGVLAARWLRPPGWGGDGGPFGGRALTALSETHRPAVEAIWQRQRDEWRRHAATVGRARQELRRQLMAEPLDRAALDRAGADLIARMTEARTAMHRNFAEIAAILPAAERERFFGAAFARHGRPRHSWPGGSAPGAPGQQ